MVANEMKYGQVCGLCIFDRLFCKTIVCGPISYPRQKLM